MSKKLLLSIIIILALTNITTFILWNRGHKVTIDNQPEMLSPDDIVATVNGESFTYLEWINGLIHDYGKNHLSSLINKEIVNQLANEFGIEVNEKIIQRDMNLLISIEDVMSEIDAELMEEDLREDIMYRYQLEGLLTKDLHIPEDEIRSFYNSYKNEYNFSETMQISHIVVREEETATKIIEELEEGSSFIELANKYSMDEETRGNGGYIGSIPTNSDFFPSGYAEVAWSMEEHTYSEPFQVENGVAILYLHRKLPSIEFSYEEIKPYIKSELALKQHNMDLSPYSLWDQVSVDWIYNR